MLRMSLLVLFVLALQASAQEIETRSIEYRDGDTVLEGYLALNPKVAGKQPGILVCHAWKGLGEHERKAAVALAKLGYVAFAVDIYGKGVRPQDATEARALSSKFKNDRPLLRKRVKAGLQWLKSLPQVDPTNTAAIGYCFGGTTVLELARSGADVKGVVSFHGGLGTNTPEDAAKIKAKVLVLHGGDDPAAPIPEVIAMMEEMRRGGVDWQVHLYGGAVHSFTDENAGNDPKKGSAYNETAARRSWEAMGNFFQEIFR